MLNERLSQSTECLNTKQEATSHFSHSRNSSSFIKSQFHCRISNSPPTECVTCQMNTIHTFTLRFRLFLTMFLHLRLAPPNQSLASIISTKAFSISSMRTKFPPYHNILNLVNIIQREQQTLQHGSNN